MLLATITVAVNAPENGIAPMCKNGGTNGESHYVLTAGDGYILTPDNNSIYMWSYSNGSDAFQYPGPALCLTEGDAVTITLVNKLPVPTSFNVLGITGQSFMSGFPSDFLSGTASPGHGPWNQFVADQLSYITAPSRPLSVTESVVLPPTEGDNTRDRSTSFSGLQCSV